MARKAPTTLAKTSKISALRVVVMYCCINSIEIPKKKENPKDKTNGLKILAQFNFFLKYKNQSIVNIK